MSKMSLPSIVEIHSLSELDAFAKKIAMILKPGSVVGLEGSLGAGKTTFVQFLAKHLKITQPITSPTFTIMHEYPWKSDSQFYHLDCYRLRRIDEVLGIGLTELIDEKKHLIVIEWPGVAQPLIPAGTIWCTFEVTSDHTRKITTTLFSELHHDTFH